MRPRGPHRSALTGFVSGGGKFTMRELASKMGCTIDRADDVIRRAMNAGEVRPAGTRRVDGVKRPVTVYEGADVCTDREGAPTLAAALQAWGK